MKWQDHKALYLAQIRRQIQVTSLALPWVSSDSLPVSCTHSVYSLEVMPRTIRFDVIGEWKVVLSNIIEDCVIMQCLDAFGLCSLKSKEWLFRIKIKLIIKYDTFKIMTCWLETEWHFKVLYIVYIYFLLTVLLGLIYQR